MQTLNLTYKNHAAKQLGAALMALALLSGCNSDSDSSTTTDTSSETTMDTTTDTSTDSSTDTTTNTTTDTTDNTTDTVNASKVNFVNIPASGDMPAFKMSETEITNEMYAKFLNEALAKGLVTMTPSKDPFGLVGTGRFVFDAKNGNPLIDLSGSRVVKDHNKDGTYTVAEMENPSNRCFIGFDGSKFFVVDPAMVNWNQYFDSSKYPNVVDDINDWAELNAEGNGRHSYADTDKKLPTVDEVKQWPVNYVRYFGADAFAKFYGYDIPTKVQWKIAAKAGPSFVYATNDGAQGNTNPLNAWFDDTEGAWMKGAPVPATHVQPVKSVAPNAYGLYSMGGNVYEWVADWYQPDPSIPADPFKNTTGVEFVDGEDGRESISMDDLRIDKTKPLSDNNMYVKTGIGGAHNFPSLAMMIDSAMNPHPFPQYANDHFGFRVVQ